MIHAHLATLAHSITGVIPCGNCRVLKSTAFTISPCFRSIRTRPYAPRPSPIRISCRQKHKTATRIFDRIRAILGQDVKTEPSTVDISSASNPPTEREPASAITIVPQISKAQYQRNSASRRWGHRAYGLTGRSSKEYGSERPLKSKERWGPVVVYTRSRLQRPGVPQQSSSIFDTRNMSSSVRVMTTPTSDTNGTTFLFQEGANQYLVGRFSEGSQRVGPCQGIRVTRTQQCFLTGRTGWESTGGFIGMLMALRQRADRSFLERKRADSPSQRHKMTVFGPPRLSYQMATTRRYVFRKDVTVAIEEVGDEANLRHEPDLLFEDQNIRVWGLPLTPNATPGAVSSRKRSHEESEGVDASETNPSHLILSDDLPEQKHYDMVLKGVISEMCNSEWKLDTLFPTRLADVKMPATIFIRNAQTQKIEKYRGPLPDSGATYDPELMVLVRKPWPGAMITDLPPSTPSNSAVSYIFQRHATRGKFDKDKAVALKIQPGRRYTQLLKGEPVENDDGLLITPDQVLGPSQFGDCLAVIDLPNQTYIEAFLGRAEWSRQDLVDGMRFMFWLCEPDVLQDSRIKAFMSKLAHVEHIVSGATYTGDYLANRLGSQFNIMLSAIDNARFPLLTHDADVPRELELPPNVGIALPGQAFELKQDSKANNSFVLPPLDVQTELANISQDVLQKTKKAQQAVEVHRTEIKQWADSIPGRDAEITTLGTGSAEPSNYRNVSATLLRVPDWGAMLFDCGEGTLGQLKRAYSREEFRQIIDDLRIIAISHSHADHHMGLVGVINAWYQQVHASKPGPMLSNDVDFAKLLDMKDRLAIIAEPAMHASLREYSAIDDFGYSRIAPIVASPSRAGNDSQALLRWFIPPAEVATASNSGSDFARDIAPHMLGLANVQTALVKHCVGARGYAFTWPDQFKVSYSGDTRPSADFARIGKDSTVCIHEATFDDDLPGEAIAKQHSTIGEALGIADAMGAKACILTHFSQRYSCGDELAEILKRLCSSNIEANQAPSHTSAKNSNDVDSQLRSADLHPHPAHEANTDMEDVAAIPSDGPSVLAEDSEPVPASIAGDEFDQTSRYKLRSDLHIGVGLDMMRVKVGQIPELKYFYPAIGELCKSLRRAREEQAAKVTRELAEKAESKAAKKAANKAANQAANQAAHDLAMQQRNGRPPGQKIPAKAMDGDPTDATRTDLSEV